MRSLPRSTQLVFGFQSGQAVPRLREPRQLYGVAGHASQALSRWPKECEVIGEKIRHIGERVRECGELLSELLTWVILVAIDSVREIPRLRGILKLPLDCSPKLSNEALSPC